MIPVSIRKRISEDDFYKICILTGRNNAIVLHHTYIYSGKSIQEKDLIMPVTKRKHARVGGDLDSIHNCNKTKEIAKWHAINLVDIFYLQKKYPKFNWSKEKDRLNNKFGEWNEINKQRQRI